ncbi:MAG: inner membrane-spanning protein YciB [Paracoccus sp. (in: a-proteobacteria)]|nr:inner membrane-spanning protein YciB [Paracoccus sp. (in: a-proteobacteria)]
MDRTPQRAPDARPDPAPQSGTAPDDIAQAAPNPALKAALEYGPLLLFFAVFMLMGDRTVDIGGQAYGRFIVSTMVFVPVMAAATLAQWAMWRTLSVMQIVTLVLVVVFGGLTIWLNDERFFKIKPTLIYLMFAAILGAGLLAGRSLLSLVLAEALPLKPEGWRILTIRMTVFFVVMAGLNELVWRNMSDTAWVNFKTFGLPLLMFVFIISNARLFSRYALEKPGE